MDSKLLKVCVVMLAAMGLSACSDDDSSDSKSCDAATYAETCVDASSYKTCVNGKVETNYVQRNVRYLPLSIRQRVQRLSKRARRLKRSVPPMSAKMRRR